MVFLFLLDVVTSILCKCVFKVGSWVVYQSYNGVYYLYNSSGIKNENAHIENKKNEVDLSPYVIITEEEYDILKNEKKCKIHKRNVSSLTKKMVASNQQWKCGGSCNQTLDYTYEIDHHIPLFKGGSNEISNLIALCRNCHGKNTLFENNNIG